MEPVLLANLYGHQEKVDREKLILEVVGAFHSTGLPWIVLGDFNEQDSEGACARIQANGVGHAWDDDHRPHVRPTRHPGKRCIDFGVSSRDLRASHREQVAGIRDHDLVCYQVQCGHEHRHPFVLPKRKKLKEGVKVTAEQLWANFDLELFNLKLANDDVDGAWQLLSACAEACTIEGGGGGLPRHAEVRSSRSQAQHKSHQAAVPVREARLHRLCRRAKELLKRPEDHELRRQVVDTLRVLAKHWPSLLECSGLDESAVQAISKLAEEVLLNRRQDVLLNYKAGIADDTAAQRRWIRSERDEQLRVEQRCQHTLNLSGALHPAEQVEGLAVEWTTLWNKQHAADGIPRPVDRHDFQRYLAEHHAAIHAKLPVLPLDDQHGGKHLFGKFTADKLRSTAKRMRRKASAVDGWTADNLLLMPDEWWMLLAQLWNIVLATGRIPERWAEARTVLIPKKTGGWRPLTITCICWRLGVSIIARWLGGTADAWMPHPVQGCVPRRGAHWIHARLRFAQRQAADRTRATFVDDISKAFDHVHIGQALAVLWYVGIDERVLWLLFQFYGALKRLFQVENCCSQHWHRGKHGLAQGCPASPMLLAGIMSVWSWFFKVRTDLEHGVFVDDRCWWDDGPASPVRVADAQHVAAEADRVFGFSCNSKAQAMASSKAARASMRARLPERVPVGASLRLLGMSYDASARAEPVVDPPRIAVFCTRACRIGFAARARGHRRNHLRSLAYPLLTWSAPFVRLPALCVQKLRTATWKALIGWQPQARSRFMLQATMLEAKDLIDCVMASATLGALHRWVHQQLSAWQEELPLDFISAGPEQWAPAVREQLRRWGWIWNAARATVVQPAVANRAERVFRVHYDSVKVLHRWCEERCLEDLFSDEGRVWRPAERRRRLRGDGLDAMGLRIGQPARNLMPEVGAHCAYMKQAGILDCDHWQLVLGCGLNAWGPTWKLDRRQPEEVQCLCGLYMPSFSHLMWCCSGTLAEREEADISPPTNTAEERLLVRCLARPVLRCDGSHHAPRPNLELTAALSAVMIEMEEAGHRKCYVGTDGGAKTGAAAWSVSWRVPCWTDYASAAGPMLGEDLSSFSAELEAARQLLLALECSALENITVCWAYDCKPIRAFLDGRPPGQLLGVFRDLQRSLQALAERGCRIVLSWIPSHDKALPAGWSCDPATCEAECRAANAAADHAATVCLETAPEGPEDSARRAAVADARLWSSKALLLASRLMAKWRSHCEIPEGVQMGSMIEDH